VLRTAFLSLLSAALTVAQSVPKFEQFSTGAKFVGIPATPVLTTPRSRLFRTAIRDGAKKGPNFAGHFTVVTWGCGSECAGAELVDAQTGGVFDFPFDYLGWALPGERYPDGSNWIDLNFRWLDFRSDSRLMIVRGCPHDKDCGVYYYEWTGTQFHLLSAQKVAR